MSSIERPPFSVRRGRPCHSELKPRRAVVQRERWTSGYIGGLISLKSYRSSARDPPLSLVIWYYVLERPLPDRRILILAAVGPCQLTLALNSPAARRPLPDGRGSVAPA